VVVDPTKEVVSIQYEGNLEYEISENLPVKDITLIEGLVSICFDPDRSTGIHCGPRDNILPNRPGNQFGSLHKGEGKNKGVQVGWDIVQVDGQFIGANDTQQDVAKMLEKAKEKAKESKKLFEVVFRIPESTREKWLKEHSKYGPKYSFDVTRGMYEDHFKTEMF